MRKFLAYCIVLVVGLSAIRAHADEATLVSGKEPITIPFGETHKLQFGTVPQKDTTVPLKIKSRMDFASRSGSMHFMKIFGCHSHHKLITQKGNP